MDQKFKEERFFYTKNNHFKWGYKHKPFSWSSSNGSNWNSFGDLCYPGGTTEFSSRHSETDEFYVQYGKCSRKPRRFLHECVRTANEIYFAIQNLKYQFYKDWVKPGIKFEINILLSGGIDSEIVARSFLLARKPFKCIIYRFNDDINLHDICYAISFCETYEIDYEIIDINIHNFFKSSSKKNEFRYKVFDYGFKGQCVSPQLSTILYMADQVRGIPIIGSGECYLQKENGSWFLYEQEKVASLYKYFWLTKGPAIPGFFQWNPEIMLSFLEDKMIQDLVKSDKNSSKEIKFDFYKKHFPDIVPRKKYTGFEKIMDLDKEVRNVLNYFPLHSNEVAKTEYNELINILKK